MSFMEISAVLVNDGEVRYEEAFEQVKRVIEWK